MIKLMEMFEHANLTFGKYQNCNCHIGQHKYFLVLTENSKIEFDRGCTLGLLNLSNYLCNGLQFGPA